MKSTFSELYPHHPEVPWVVRLWCSFLVPCEQHAALLEA